MKFKYANDVFEFRVWSWIKSKFTPDTNTVPTFRSTHLEFEFTNFSEYWQEVGRRNVLIDAIKKAYGQTSPALGFQIEEVLLRFTRALLGNSPTVIIYNIRPEGVGKLIDRFPGLSRSLFLVDDVILLKGKDKDSVRRITLAIPQTMADVIGVNCGEAFVTNQDIEE